MHRRRPPQNLSFPAGGVYGCKVRHLQNDKWLRCLGRSRRRYCHCKETTDQPRIRRLSNLGFHEATVHRPNGRLRLDMSVGFRHRLQNESFSRRLRSAYAARADGQGWVWFLGVEKSPSHQLSHPEIASDNLCSRQLSAKWAPCRHQVDSFRVARDPKEHH
jgi:hypothetical protein